MEKDGFRLEQRHGKSRVRVARVWRSPKSETVVEWSLNILLYSDVLPSYTNADNSSIVATDSIKNTVYAKAKECEEQLAVEDFGILLGRHFISKYSQVTGVSISITEKPWERVFINDKPHKHGFKLGVEKHIAEISLQRGEHAKITSGIEGLALLKTTQSGFEGFVRDEYTFLPETKERILATEVTAKWSYLRKPSCFNTTYNNVKLLLSNTFLGPPEMGVYSPSVQNTLYLMAQSVLQRVLEIDSIQLSMPNIHFLPANLSNIVKFEHDVYVPTDEPYGTIQATLTRKGFKPLSKL
eukprot:TRINITY_DN5419_c0_g1_i1.p1 TRINITY_DN5419_c0_g1~~TRINITY_DN5419_c0_g1_i1.p1  ORF type:complete len:297 (-),score=54.65 TRINITY_DN5419_c0_g1_i1:190-1080(-)